MNHVWHNLQFSCRQLGVIACRKIAGAAVHRRGNVAILTAVMLPALVGGMGLGAEVGLWYFKQRQLQHAADVAAYGAGVRRRAGDSQSQMQVVALDLAARAGFDPGSGTITLNNPPSSGPNSAAPNAIEVILTDSLPLVFTSLFLDAPVALKARAVVRVQNGGVACTLALSTTAPSAMRASGTSNVDLENCNAASNSVASDAFNMVGGADFSTGCLYTVGLANTTSGLTLYDCDRVNEMAPVTPDPYKDVPEPAPEGPCEARNVGQPHGLTTVTPTYNHSSGVKSMRFCNGLQLKGDVHFKPGLYIIEGGDFSANADANITGDGVTFFFTNGAASKLNGSADLDLAAPTSGPFSGLLFFGSRSKTGIQHTVNGGSNSKFQGAIYFSGSAVTYTGGASVSGGCTQVIGLTVEFGGGSHLGSSCAAAGTRDIVAGDAVSLVE